LTNTELNYIKAIESLENLDKLSLPLLNHLIYNLSVINEFQDDTEAQFRVKVVIHEDCGGKTAHRWFTTSAAAYHFIGS